MSYHVSVQFSYNQDKNLLLQKERYISFEDAIEAINQGNILDIINHPTRGQIIFVIRMFDYIYAVPAVIEDDNKFFLKTVYPSRDLKKQYDDN